MTEHLIIPPPELVEQWKNLPEYTDGRRKMIMVTLSRERLLGISTQAAQYGADQELEACCEWVEKTIPSWAPHTLNEQLRLARRPKPPSLKEQAIHELEDAYDKAKLDDYAYNTIRRALEELNDGQVTYQL
jgi:hypothetical protein